MSIRVVMFALTASLAFTVHAGAQVTETQIPFDSTGKVRSLTPSLVARYQLTAPVWPVSGDFNDARLYTVSTGGLVLAVERRSGSVERYAMTEDAADALRSAIDAALKRTGAAVTEAQPDVFSEPARGALVRNQMILSWVLYAPLLSSLANDGKTATALYLLSIGSSYFITTGIGKKVNVTRAQNHLATDGAFRGWAASSGLLYTVAGDSADGKTYRALGLLGALGGAVSGFRHGRGLTDGEAQAATAFSTFAALTTLGLAGTTGLLRDADSVDAKLRATVGASVATGLIGYLWGPRYPRTARYAVTKGDVQLLTLGATLGVMAATTPIVDADPEPELGFGIATAGLVGGIFAADRLLARPFDHTTSDATQIGLGALAGGLMGTAISVIAEPNATGTMALVTAGAIGGAILGHKLTAPRRAEARSSRMPQPGAHLGDASIELNPMGLALSAAGVRGPHALLSVHF